MVTSALCNQSFLSNGSTWQLLSEVFSSEEGNAASEGIGSLTDLESRLADAHEGEVENLLDGNGKAVDNQGDVEERERVRGVRRSMAERRVQWLDRRDRTRTTPAVAKCFVNVQTGEMSGTDAQNEVACLEVEEAFRFEQLMRDTFTYEPGFRVFTWALDWAFGSADEVVGGRREEEDAERSYSESVHAMADGE
jgi:hypothetical protein